ncbi:MAG: putative 2OG-Fe(II) oxygenase [Lentisphaerota bacterium]
MNEQFKKLYPTDVLFGSFADYDRLTELVTELLSKNDIKPNTNELGEASLFDRLDELPEVARFKQHVVEPAFDRYLRTIYNLGLDDIQEKKFKSWLSGDRMSSHNHNNSYFSAVFYILTESKKGGEIEFCDPRPNANRGYQKEFLEKFKNIRIEPASGEFIIFPAYLYHAVLPFHGQLRLSMPVDLFIHRN